MNRSILGPLVTVLLLTVSWAAAADENETLKEECRSIAAGHGVEAGQMDTWIQRCVENTSRIRADMDRQKRQDADKEEQGDHGH